MVFHFGSLGTIAGKGVFRIRGVWDCCSEHCPSEKHGGWTFENSEMDDNIIFQKILDIVMDDEANVNVPKKQV